MLALTGLLARSSVAVAAISSNSSNNVGASIPSRSGGTETKHCIACKHFRPAKGLGLDDRLNRGICVRQPTSYDIVTGVPTYKEARTERYNGNDDACGYDGAHFEPCGAIHAAFRAMSVELSLLVLVNTFSMLILASLALELLGIAMKPPPL
jgi:hypothetical protein